MKHAPARHPLPKSCLLVAASLLLCGTAAARSQEMAEERVDEARGKPLGAGGKGNWIVVPVPIANPTVGNGLQVAALYLHGKKPGQETAPGGTTGLVAMGTDTGTQLTGAFHDNSFSNDRFRVTAFGGSGKFKLKFYGLGQSSPLVDKPLGYEIDGTLAQVRASVRLPGTQNWFAGLTYQYLEATLRFDTSEIAPGLPDIPARFKSTALGPQLTLDSRDSNYYPQQGQYFRISWLRYSERWDSDFDFDKVDTFYNHYLPLSPASVVALRARLQVASDNTPFYALPTLDMRGFSADRYRDTHTVSLTSEWRHRFAPRWGLVAYAEVGRFGPGFEDLRSSRTIATLGSGVRWRVTADREMNIGLDVAFSSDDRALFIQIGERF